MHYSITIKCIVDEEDRDPEDVCEMMIGDSYEYEANSKDDALDQFHYNVPINELGDYEIICRKKRKQ